MLYAQINFDTSQMIGSPRALPQRWTTPEGVTINGFDKLPQVALYGLGWVPVIYETISNPETHKHSLAPAYDEDNKQFVFPAEPRDLSALKAAACTAIDQAAGDASARYITVAAGQEARYLLKLEQAKLCQTILADSDDPTEQCPMIVQEAASTGQTVGQTAQGVLDQAAAWLTVAAGIEAARIGGKQAVQTATDNAAVIVARDAAVVTLEAI